MILQLHFDSHREFLNIRTDADLTDIQFLPLCLQFDTSHYTVPVALRLIGNAMGILPHADVLNTVVDADGNRVTLATIDIIGDIIAMRRRKRHLMSNTPTVHIDGGLDVRTFQKQCDTSVFPVFGNIDATLIPSVTYIMLFRCQKERKLHLPLNAIFRHIGIEIERRVVERTRPLRLGSDIIALAVGQHGTWQHDIIVIDGAVAKGEVPRACEGNCLRSYAAK